MCLCRIFSHPYHHSWEGIPRKACAMGASSSWLAFASSGALSICWTRISSAPQKMFGGVRRLEKNRFGEAAHVNCWSNCTGYRPTPF